MFDKLLTRNLHRLNFFQVERISKGIYCGEEVNNTYNTRNRSTNVGIGIASGSVQIRVERTTLHTVVPVAAHIGEQSPMQTLCRLSASILSHRIAPNIATPYTSGLFLMIIL